MGERYWVMSTQLGLMKVKSTREKTIKKVIDEQFIGNFPNDKDKEWFDKQIIQLIKKAELR